LGGCLDKTPTETAAPKQAAAQAAEQSQNVLVSTTSSPTPAGPTWTLVDPDQTDGPQMMLLSGDPKATAFTAMIKLPAGYASALHSHDVAFHGIAISGTVTNGRTAEDAVEIKAGGIWTQPANEAHFTGCTGDIDCVFIASMEGALNPKEMDEPAKESTQTIINAFDIEYTLVDPDQPDGPGTWQLPGQMTKGSFGTIMNVPSGTNSPDHLHASRHTAAVISGTMTHSDGQTFSGGEVWIEDADGPHSSGCSSDIPCIFFVTTDGDTNTSSADQ
jgi:quercetin dioxygenase-like cupin family protein